MEEEYLPEAKQEAILLAIVVRFDQEVLLLINPK
jgi:hypothetical protein